MNKIDKLEPLPEWLKLREVQRVMFDNLAKSYKAGYRKQVLVAPTGSGKTIWTAVLFHRILSKKPEAKLIFVVPRITLATQTAEVFESILQLPISIIQGQHESIDLSLNIQVATIQTLGNRIKKYPELFRDYDCCVIDEAHLSYKARESIHANWLISLTATPYAKGMGLFYDDLVRSIPAIELEKQGIITPLKVLCAKKQIDTGNLSITSTGEYTAAEEETEVFKLIGDVLKEYENNPEMENRPFIGFAKTIKACVALSDTFEDAGHKVAYVHSKMSDNDNEAILESFKNGHLIGVFSVIKLTEGFDFIGASALLLCTSFAPDKEGNPNALARWAQMHGRIRRADPDNHDKIGLVHDHGDNWSRYAHPDIYEAEFTELCKNENKEAEHKEKESSVKMKECPECGYYVKGKFCLFCGHELKKYSEFIDGEVVEFEDGKMVEVMHKKTENQKKKEKKFSKQDFYSMLLTQAQVKGYKKGWEAHKYRDYFGCWPRSLSKGLMTRTPEFMNYLTYLNIQHANRNKK